MKLNKKKGFTIVELVIVIAVIAILAAVLIPNISKLVKKANQSADESLVRNLNTDEEEENASYVDLDLWMRYFIEVLRYNNPMMSGGPRGA